jgi:hypothetical protein
MTNRGIGKTYAHGDPKPEGVEFLEKEGRSEQARKIEAERPEKIDHELRSAVLESTASTPPSPQLHSVWDEKH